jgi:hypothetical protein
MLFLQTTSDPNVICATTDWPPIILAFFATACAIFTTVLVIRSQNRTIRRNEVYKRLNEFYGPLEQYRKRSEELYRRFSSRHKEQNPDFRTLPVLLDTNLDTFTENEKVLLKEIIECGRHIERLIFDKAGLIDHPELSTIWLPKLTHHILIFRLAYIGELKGDDENIAKDVFPRGIDAIISKRKQELINELTSLGKMYDPVHG